MTRIATVAWSVVAALALDAQAQTNRIFWGASGGFFYCGSNSPAQPIFIHATQLVAQLIFTVDATRGIPSPIDHLTPEVGEILLDQMIVTPAEAAGSGWGDFVGKTTLAVLASTGYVYGRIVSTPEWSWYGVYDGPVRAIAPDTAYPDELPPTYDFTPGAAGAEMGWNYCLSCPVPCPDGVLSGFHPTDTNLTVDYLATDPDGTYRLQVSYDLESGTWIDAGTNVATGQAVTTNHGAGAFFRIIKE
jgi:hypothetical protein